MEAETCIFVRGSKNSPIHFGLFKEADSFVSTRMRLPENILKIARAIRYNCTSLTGMNLAGMKWAMQTETAAWTRRMVSIWMVRGKNAQEPSQRQEAILEVLQKTMILFLF